MSDSLQNRKWLRVAVLTAILLIPLFYFFSPMIFEGKRPTGVDISASLGNTHLYKEYQDKTGEKVLWNPNIFAGMPVYPRITPQIPGVGTLLSKLGRIAYQFFWYYLAGALGVFFLLRYKKVSWYLALIPAMAFMLLPHWMALIHLGHFAKLRAFMAVPWVILAFNYLFDKRSWLAVGLFAAAFSWITRTQHFQVVFYSILVMLFIFLVPTIKLLIEKKYKEFGDLALKVIVSIVLTIAVSCQPFLSLHEYTPYSTRGGNSVSLNEKSMDQQNSNDKGVGFDYATRWSLDVKGVGAFFLPRFAGGLVQETYRGSEHAGLKGKKIPGYWGGMPFTQSYDYMGLLIFLFALTGMMCYWKKSGFVRSLTIFSIFALLLAFGRHFPPLYRLFFNYFPYFSKFRVPSMIVNMIFVVNIVLAGYGLTALFEKARQSNWKFIAKLFGIASAVLLLLLVVSSGFSFEKSGEAARYGARSMTMIKSIRREMLTGDIFKALLLCLGAGGVLIAASFKKIKYSFAGILLGLFVFLELFTVTGWAYENMNLGRPGLLERREFRRTDITRYLSSQDKDFRALALGGDSNHYSYFYPTISGYSAIKLQTIQDIREHCLYAGGKINWPVVNMLGGKYIIAPGRLEESHLNAVAGDKNRKDVLYENSRALPKAWFVKKVDVRGGDADILRAMNSGNFDPTLTALVSGPGAQAKNYSASGEIELLSKTPNRLAFKVTTDEKQFAVFSEMYYPIGWTLTADGTDIAIKQVNYCLRGAELPAGDYTLVMDFHPKTYYSGVRIAWAASFIMLLLIAVPLVLRVTGRGKK